MVRLETRPVQHEDLAYLKAVIDSSGLFPSQLLDDMISDYFTNPSETSDIWITCTDKTNNIPISIGYCSKERMTKGTYNLLAIAVQKDKQGKGVGTSMIRYLERSLREEGNRVLLVETSGLDEYELTRRFYKNCGFRQEAVIHDFYDAGEDKVVFWKKL